jgi:hypothetical protein
VDNVSVEFRYGLFSMRKSHARLRAGSQYVNFAYVTPKELRELLAQQESYPLRLGKINERTYGTFRTASTGRTTG